MEKSVSLQSLPAEVLRDRLRGLAALERRSLANQLRHLGEVQRRGVSAEWGYPSMFYYCTEELKFSEAAAYKRITAARKALACPALLDLVERGELNLEGILILAPHIHGNDVELIERARGKKSPALQALVAEISPRPDVRDFTMRLPSPSAPARPNSGEAQGAAEMIVLASPCIPAPQAVVAQTARVEHLSPGRLHLGMTIDAELWEKIRRVRSLLWHKHPDGKLEKLLGELVEFFLKRQDPLARARRRAARGGTGGMPAASRPAVSAAVRDAVFLRAGGLCAFVSEDGRVCGSSDGLELDHATPRALGGSNAETNLRALCRQHNQLSARRLFGARAGARRK